MNGVIINKKLLIQLNNFVFVFVFVIHYLTIYYLLFSIY